MADSPLPSPRTAPPDDPAQAPAEAVQPAVNGAPASPPASAAEPPRPASALFQEWAVYRATQLGLIAALAVVLYFVLSSSGFKGINAAGLAVILAVVGSFFLRPLMPIPSPAEKTRAATPERNPFQQTDSFREIIETVVFVVVLVLMLKTFVAEAFVIPTGSMAETLYGYQKLITCPSCAYEFPVNCSAEVDPSDGPQAYVSGCVCPNCRQQIRIVPPVLPDGSRVDASKLPAGHVVDPGWNSGDRVLVAKFVYDLPDRQPDRLDVVVFKFPGDEGFPQRSGPVKKHSPMNYIKRLVGRPGETIAIHRGKLYVLPAGQLTFDDVEKAAGDPSKLAQLWHAEYMHPNDKRALDLFDNGAFAIYRKPPAQIRAMMRLVYDNDHPAKDLAAPEAQRWRPDPGGDWEPAGKYGFRHQGGKGGIDWLRYRHVLRGSDKPSLITDFMGYNTWEASSHHTPPGENWASDLILECQVQVGSPVTEFALELSRGRDRFRATFDLANGTCTLSRLGGHGKAVELKSASTSMKGSGSYHVRFGNVDDRLVVWVDGALPFGDGVPYDAPLKLAPTRENDLERPASIGASAGVTVSAIKLYRDTYYTTARGGQPSAPDVPRFIRNDAGEDVLNFDPSDARTFGSWEQAPVATFYVQPDHFLCLGDNSPESSDGRSWGLVPRRLLLGRALLVYYPFNRAGRIR